MIKLLFPGNDTGGGAPIDTSLGATEVTKNITPTDIKYTDEELKALGQMAQPAFKQGFFKRMLVDPQAAAELPKPENIHTIGKVGLFNVFSSPTPEFPFEAWAQQHQPAPASLNTKMMQQVAQQLKEPQADPRVQRNLDNQFSGFLNDIYKEGESKFGNMQNVNRILSGNYYNEAERDWDENRVHRGMQYFVNGANLSKDIAKNLDYIDKNVTGKGEQVSSDYVKALQDYRNSFEGGFGEDNIKKMEGAADKLNTFTNLEELAKKFVPEGFKWGETSFITGAKTEDGKNIPYAYSEWKVTNPDGVLDVDKSKTFRDVVEKINQQTLRNGTDLGYKNDDDRKKFIAEYLADKSSQVKTESIHTDRPAVTNVYTQPVQTGTVYQAQTETTTFGTGDKKFSQTANSSYPITPFKADLGTLNNVIGSSGQAGTVDLNNATVGQFQTRRVKVIDGKLQVTDESGGDSFVAPVAQANAPKYTFQPKLNQAGEPIKNPATGELEVTRLTTGETETYFIPLSYVANIKTTDNNTASIDQAYKDAETQNQADATEQGNKEFQKYFGMTKIDVYKQKKTGAKSTKETTSAPDYNVPLK